MTICHSQYTAVEVTRHRLFELLRAGASNRIAFVLEEKEEERKKTTRTHNFFFFFLTANAESLISTHTHTRLQLGK